jgi:hypothetical protein
MLQEAPEPAGPSFETLFLAEQLLRMRAERILSNFQKR